MLYRARKISFLLLTLAGACLAPGAARAQSTINSTFTITVNCTATVPPDSLYSTVTISVRFNYPPAPVWVSPAGAPAATVGYTLNQRPKVWFYANDLNGHQLQDWMLVTADDAAFTVNVATFQVTVAAAGWNPSAWPLAQGATFYYTPQANWTQAYHYLKCLAKDKTDPADPADRAVWGESAVRKVEVKNWAWTDASLTAGSTPIRRTHLTELRDVISNLRLFRTLAAPSWTDPDVNIIEGDTPVRKVHLTEMRQYLDDALFKVGQSTGAATWTDYNITPSVTTIRKTHFQDLRDKCVIP